MNKPSWSSYVGPTSCSENFGFAFKIENNKMSNINRVIVSIPIYRISSNLLTSRNVYSALH